MFSAETEFCKTDPSSSSVGWKAAERFRCGGGGRGGVRGLCSPEEGGNGGSSTSASKWTVAGLGVDVMVTIFCDFRQFQAEKNKFKNGFVSSQRRQFLAKIF
jgi:hypothetical protein